MLDERKAAILAALVEDHIASGAPVSSRAILERSGLDCSAATVRNDLAFLEREGFVTKPHASAGRKPSDRGYRYYLDHLSRGSLRPATVGRIETFFGTVHAEFGRMLQETTDLLTDLTSYPSIVVGPALQNQPVRDVHMLPIGVESVLLVLVCENGQVVQDVVSAGSAISDSEVADAVAAVRDAVVGKPLGESTEIAELELSPAATELVEGSLTAVAAAVESSRDLYVGGTSRMAELWEDLAKLHRVLALLEGKAEVMDLVGQGEGILVRLGTEMHTAEPDLAVVSAGFRSAGAAGRVGVLGPMRMDYRRTIRVVEEVSDALGDSLNS